MRDDMNPYQSPSAAQESEPVYSSDDEHPPFRDPNRLAIFALVLLVLVGLVEIGALLLTVFAELYLASWPGPIDSFAELNESLLLREKLRIVKLLLGVVVIVPYFAWLHRVYANLPSLNAGELNSTPFRAIAEYLVPIINLFSPYQTMTEVWRHSDPAGIDPSLRPREQHVVKVWWGAWMFCMALNLVTMNGDDIGRGTAEFPLFIRLSIFVFPLLTTVAAIVLIRRISLNQRRRYARLAHFPAEIATRASGLSPAPLDSEQPSG